MGDSSVKKARPDMFSPAQQTESPEAGRPQAPAGGDAGEEGAPADQSGSVSTFSMNNPPQTQTVPFHTLSSQQKYYDILFPAKTSVQFYKNGGLKAAIFLPGLDIQGVKCTYCDFYEGGTLMSAMLSSAQEIQGTNFNPRIGKPLV